MFIIYLFGIASTPNAFVRTRPSWHIRTNPPVFSASKNRLRVHAILNSVVWNVRPKIVHKLEKNIRSRTVGDFFQYHDLSCTHKKYRKPLADK